MLPLNVETIRPKRLNIKDFLRYIEEIYSYRFENKVKVKKIDLTGLSLQEASAFFMQDKFKAQKKKAD